MCDGVCVCVRACVCFVCSVCGFSQYNDETTLYVIPSTKTEVSECESVSVIYCKARCRMHVLPYKGHTDIDDGEVLLNVGSDVS